MVESSEAHRAKRKKPYNERSDLEKLQSQWNKLSGLHMRDEPSAAIVRCSTAAEIAANYAIRHEWARQTEFDATIIDQLLLWANGLRGKIDKLFVPVYFAHPKKSKTAKALIASSEKINKVRNEVVHQGRFSNPDEAAEIIAEAKRFIDMIVGLSVPGFDIQDRKRTE
ncbi:MULTISPECIES: hypothetical protein [unclassified Sphingomonas]|uniref:hypothetical protein n=1 Tax=unclassified Sphingomonas TaxID=196159 RepID=UPI00092AFA23|nr:MULTISPECIES: hypothetical protein [unclassified Sphingomonas]OJV33278.1 MAG: hypothetical protein BGO24_09465 [Sphingomonas sp. 67-36]